jgi:hypothetical protein
MFAINGKTIDLDGMRLELYSAKWKQGPAWEPLTDEGREGPIRALWNEGTSILLLDKPEEETDIVAYIVDGDARFAIVRNDRGAGYEPRYILHRIYKDPHVGMTDRIIQWQQEGRFQPLS